jgi:hypothetical protein
MIVWALFDSETDCVKKALPECEVYSFGIGSGTGHIHLDLSDFETAKKELDKYPKPDCIFASPPCESWVRLSIAHVCKFTAKKGFNLHWEKKWIPFDFKPKYRETRLNGIRTAECLAKIIQHYKPEFWAIENGISSILFDYLKEFCLLKGIESPCKYGCYNFNVLKPTIILSNKRLELKNYNPRRRFTNIARRTRKYNAKARKQGIAFINDSRERSKVPPELYRDIMRQFHNRQPVLFGEDL